MGLLLTHKRKLRIWGDMLSVSCPHESEPSGGGQRGDIEVFSAASRYRLFRQLHQIKFGTVTFITLTYPVNFPTEPIVYKGHLKEWRRRFEPAYGKVPAIWRLEFQKRGAPHFHIMYLDMEFIPAADLCWLWKCVVHSWDMAHELLGVDVKLITDSKEQALIASYLGKYIAKVDERSQADESRHVGRWWGRWNIIDPAPMEYEVSDREAVQIVNFVLAARRGGQKWEPIDHSLCSVFGSSMGGGEFGALVRGYADYLEKRGR